MRALAVLLACCGGTLLLAQQPAAVEKPASPINEAHAREVVGFLASDELAGRDTPSPGLERAADYIADQMQKAGLRPGAGDSWFHGYKVKGFQLDSTAITVTVYRDVKGKAVATKTFEPDTEVRLLRGCDLRDEQDRSATVVFADDPRVDNLLLAAAGRQATVLEVDDHDPMWLQSAGVHQAVIAGRSGARPVFVVRRGLLPRSVADEVKDTSYRITWHTAAPERVDIGVRNVVGLLRGSGKPDEYVMVSAHYDHIGIGRPVNGDAINNGADDDASGTTAVVLLAEAMAKQPPPLRSVLFVCFSGEEKGLLGSRAFAADPPVPLARIVADLNIEMIGRPEVGKQKQAWITGSEYSDFAAIAKPALQRAGIELVDFRLARMLFAQSDNYSLARQGVVAHSLSAGSLHEDYHRPSDEVAKLDLPHMTAVIAGLHEVVRALADRAEPPAYNEEGKAQLQRRR